MANKIIDALEKEYCGQGSALVYKSPFELLVAVILSAQCTDVRVNKITSELFKCYNTPEAMAKIKKEDLIRYIKSCGFYNTKSSSIIAASKSIVENFNGEVPQTMDELLTLNGVGRKTANVVLANAFNKDAFAVDTHVFRVTHRLGLSKGKTPDAVEKDMTKLIPKGKWKDAHHWLIWHGRRVCKARNPLCEDCVLKTMCPYKNKMDEKKKCL
ncbi:MAG: endonuclease III [Eubacteriales bacterium]